MADDLTPPGLSNAAPTPVETPVRPQRRRRPAQGIEVAHAAGKAGDTARRVQIAMMAGASCTPSAIARGLNLSRARVAQILAEAETAKLVEEARSIVRAHTIGESLDIAIQGMAWVKRAIENEDPKEFDLVTRGMGNLEKIWSSASGEHKPQGVQVAVINQQPGSTAAEIAFLVEKLVGPSA